MNKDTFGRLDECFHVSLITPLVSDASSPALAAACRQVFEKTIFTEIYNALMDFQPEPDEKEEGGRKAEEVSEATWSGATAA